MVRRSSSPIATTAVFSTGESRIAGRSRCSMLSLSQSKDGFTIAMPMPLGLRKYVLSSLLHHLPPILRQAPANLRSSSVSIFASPNSVTCLVVNNDSSNTRKSVRRKSVEIIAVDGNFESSKPFSNSTDDAEFNSRRLSYRSPFGNGALWKKILFESRKVRSIILLNVITIVYASNIPVVKEVEAVVDPEAFTVVRFALAAIPFTLFVFRARDDAQTRNAGIELGFWLSLAYILQAVGLLTADAGRASFISMFTVIVVPLIDGMLGSLIPARSWYGALMSIIGVALLESSGSPPCIGDLLTFISAVAFGIHMLRTEHISRSTKKENFLALLGYEVLVVSFLSTAWYFIESWFHGGGQVSNPFSWSWATVVDHISSFPWIPALYTGIFSTGLCLWVEMTALRDVSATEAAIIYGLEPVWGAGFAWFLLGERWGINGWIGAALVLAGSLTVQIIGATSNSLPEELKTENELSIIDSDKKEISSLNTLKDSLELVKK